MDSLHIRFAAPLTGVRVDAPAGSREQHGDVRSGQRELIERLFAGIREAVTDVERRRQQVLAEWEHAAVELAVAIASRLLYEKIEAGDFRIDRLVAEAVSRLSPRGPVTVRLHPQDLAFLNDMAAGEPPWDNTHPVQLVPDTTLTRGQCRAEAGELGVASRLDPLLKELRTHLLEGLEHAPREGH